MWFMIIAGIGVFAAKTHIAAETTEKIQIALNIIITVFSFVEKVKSSHP
jgi:hypothetical protein